jgi:hypothetical protein
MGWLNQRFAGVLVTLVLLGLGGQASAQTTVDLGSIPTSGSSDFVTSFGGWTIAFAPLSSGSCTLQLENSGSFSNSTQSSCSGVEMVGTVVGQNLNLTFEGEGNIPLSAVGSSATACGGGPCVNNYADLALSYTVTTPTGGTMSSASLSLTDSATLSNGSNDLVTADLQKITANGTSASFATSLSTNAANNPNQVTTAFGSAVSTFSVSMNLMTNGNGATPGSTLALNSVSALFVDPTPEPVSISLLAVGIAGLGVARYRRRRH